METGALAMFTNYWSLNCLKVVRHVPLRSMPTQWNQAIDENDECVTVATWVPLKCQTRKGTDAHLVAILIIAIERSRRSRNARKK